MEEKCTQNLKKSAKQLLLSRIFIEMLAVPRVFLKFLSKLLWVFKFQLLNPLFDVYLIFFLHIEGPSLAQDLALACDLALTQVYSRHLSSEQKWGGLFFGFSYIPWRFPRISFATFSLQSFLCVRTCLRIIHTKLRLCMFTVRTLHVRTIRTCLHVLPR